MRRFDRCEAVSPTASVAADATIRNSMIGDHVVVSAGATVVDSVLLPHAVIGRGASVDRSLVMGSVGTDSRITDCMVGADGVVLDGAALVGVSIPEPS